MRISFKDNFLNFTVALIGILLLADIILINYNNTIIKHNRELQIETESIKLYAEQIGKSTIHGLDIGLRGYFIMRDERFFTPVDSAIYRKDFILSNLESRLRNQNFDFKEFNTLKDSLNSYVVFCLHLKLLLIEKNEKEFYRLFTSDKGLELWLQYLGFIKHVSEFEDRINQEAKDEYENALTNNYVLQIGIFLICFPTLLYTAYHTKRTTKFSTMLRIAEEEKNKLLLEQKNQLEKMVENRTQVITTQNKELIQSQEETSAQRDLLAQQNESLMQAQKIIEQQNENLENEVAKRTHELVEYNQQLEQFAFISAHNLRAPVARILGLGQLLGLEKGKEARELIYAKLINTTKELDGVVRDLNTILEVKKNNDLFLSEVDLTTEVTVISKNLEKEINLTKTNLTYDFSKIKSIRTVKPYLDSILYNLISNAIKYRHPNRTPVIHIQAEIIEHEICLTVTDNGLGINTKLYGDKIFTLYQRFHDHVEGKGMGLYLVKTQMTALSGRIEIDSVVNIGTTFKAYFKA